LTILLLAQPRQICNTIGFRISKPTIGKNPVIESVVLTIPYFSSLKSTDANGDATYQLDSIYGPSDAKIMLSVFESIS
jgi:hypothetical protein